MFLVKQLQNQLPENINRLVFESKREGFRFLERLVDDFLVGTNTFSASGEILYGVFDEIGNLVGVGGLNKDPYSTDKTLGRLRRFYVDPKYRRHGIGRLLLHTIIEFAKDHYDQLVLYTDTEQGDKFYTSMGFLRSQEFGSSSHYVNLTK